jgi:hypothetical protein
MSGYIGDSKPSKLGGGIPGATDNQPNLNGTKLKNLEINDRLRLRRAFNNSRTALNYNGTSALVSKNVGLTPFRVAFNAGDPACTENEYTNIKYGREHNQISSSSLGRLNNLKLGDGARQGGNAAWSGNAKFVHDSSDYVTYKKLKAKNQTYNDVNLGGTRKRDSTVFSVLNRVRS